MSKTAPSMKNVLVGLGWDARSTDGKDFDLDASAFLLAANGKVRGDAEFIFYHHLKSAAVYYSSHCVFFTIYRFNTVVCLRCMVAAIVTVSLANMMVASKIILKLRGADWAVGAVTNNIMGFCILKIQSVNSKVHTVVT